MTTATTATIKIERAGTSRDFNVLIDGEHRATFESLKRWGRVGYDLKAVDGNDIYVSRPGHMPITKADFEDVVRGALASTKGGIYVIPTRAATDRVLLIREAEKENAERDRQIAERNRNLRREVTRVSLLRYLHDTYTAAAPDAEHRAMAERMLAELERNG